LSSFNLFKHYSRITPSPSIPSFQNAWTRELEYRLFSRSLLSSPSPQISHRCRFGLLQGQTRRQNRRHGVLEECLELPYSARRCPTMGCLQVEILSHSTFEGLVFQHCGSNRQFCAQSKKTIPLLRQKLNLVRHPFPLRE